MIEQPFGPYQIRTFRVPRDPAAPVTEVDLVERPIGVLEDGVDRVPMPPSGTAAPEPEPGREARAAAGNDPERPAD